MSSIGAELRAQWVKPTPTANNWGWLTPEQLVRLEAVEVDLARMRREVEMWEAAFAALLEHSSVERVLRWCRTCQDAHSAVLSARHRPEEAAR